MACYLCADDPAVARSACPESTAPWWRQSSWGSLLTGLVRVLSAAIGFVTVASKFGFQKSPAG